MEISTILTEKEFLTACMWVVKAAGMALICHAIVTRKKAY